MRKLTDEQISFIKENYETKGKKFCCVKLNLTQSIVGSFAHRNGLKVNRDVVSKNMSKDTINIEDYIDVKDNKIAYILGLIWTDGCVSYANNKTKTPIIKHTCVKYDSVLITEIFKQLNWRHYFNENKKSIGKNTMSVHWLSNRELGEYLISNNYRNKSLGTKIYDNFGNKCVSHFVRGLFDGDGCFVVSDAQNGKYKQFSIIFSSSSEQNWQFLTDILDKLNIKYKIRNCKDNLGESSQLVISDSESINNFSEFIYKDSNELRLERKHDKYIEFINYKNNYRNYNKWINNNEYVN